MMLAVLSRRYLFLSSVLGSLLVFFLLWGGYQKRDSFPKIGWPTSIPYASGGSSWAFDARRDATNYGLTEEQCEIAFPGLFEEPRQAAEHVRSSKKGRITPEDIDLSWKKNQILRAMIYDRELYIIDAKRVDWTRERSLSVLGQIYRAVTAYSGDLPNVEFTIAVDDGAWGDGDDNWPIWSFTRTQDKHRHWVMPGFGFWAWSEPQIGSYNEIRRKVRESEPAFEEKIPKAIWRGAPGLHPSRQKLLEYSENKPWADIKPIVWSTQESIIPMVDHCKYQFVVHTEGAANSARLIYLHNCHSVVIVPELHWLEPHLGLFKTDGPDQNVVLCKKDFSDIDEKMQDLLQNPEKARRIADNNAAAFRDRYMTPAAISCYWRAMFRAWASVSFEPQLYGMVNVTDPDTCQSHEQIGWRGQSWEKYMFSQVLYGKDKCTTKEQRIKDEEKKKEEEERKKKEKEEADRKKKLEEGH